MRATHILILLLSLALCRLSISGRHQYRLLLPIEQHAACGYIDETGTIVISPRFEHCWDFSEGFACVVVGGKTGFIDESGKFLATPRFTSYAGACYTEFKEGYAPVSVESHNKVRGKWINNSKWGFLNTKGEVIFFPGVTYLSGFREGLAFFRKGGRTGYLDTTLHVAIQLRFKSAGSFYEGRARATGVDGSEYYIDKSGKKLFDNHEGGEIQNGRAFFKINGKYGFIDKDGKVLVRPTFDGANHFGDDLAAVKVGQKWGFINDSGQFVIEPKFDEAGVFSEGMVSVSINGKWGFVDKSGEVVVLFLFDKWTYWFENGIARVRLDNKIGYIDVTGKYILSPTN